MEQVNLFEYVEDLDEASSVEANLHLLKILPILADRVVDTIISKLKEKDRYRFKIKHNLSTVQKEISRISLATVNDFVNVKLPNGVPAELFVFQCIEKLNSEILTWYRRMIEIASIPEGETSADRVNRYKKYIADRADFLYRLSPGDIFIFADDKEYCEYTFDSTEIVTENEKSDIVCLYHKLAVKLNGEIDYKVEPNIYRPIVNMTVISRETYKEAKEKYLAL